MSLAFSIRISLRISTAVSGGVLRGSNTYKMSLWGRGGSSERVKSAPHGDSSDSSDAQMIAGDGGGVTGGEQGILHRLGSGIIRPKRASGWVDAARSQSHHLLSSPLSPLSPLSPPRFVL
jgi:hypothetical protein